MSMTLARSIKRTMAAAFIASAGHVAFFNSEGQAQTRPSLLDQYAASAKTLKNAPAAKNKPAAPALDRAGLARKIEQQLQLPEGWDAQTQTRLPSLSEGSPWLRPKMKTATQPMTSNMPGYVDFCRRNPTDCEFRTETPVAVSFSEWQEKLEIAQSLNSVYKPATDMEIYGVDEYWTRPSKKADCEDYAIAKRDLLLSFNMPASAVFYVVGLDERRAGHAVLGIRTDRGDICLENRINAIVRCDVLRNKSEWNITFEPFLMVDPKDNSRMIVIEPPPPVATGAFLPAATPK